MKKYISLRSLVPLVLVLLALVVKYVYLHTAESSVDIEELPLVPLTALAHGVGRVDIADTRLYNINYITNYVFLRLFGFSIGALKITSLAFFMVAALAIFQVSRAWFQGKSGWLKYLPVSLFAFGPPVAQMWALKNRGGFIETLAFFALLVWIYQRWVARPAKLDHIYAMGILAGISVWTQPISIAFIIPIFVGIAWESFGAGWRNSIASSLRFTFAFMAGVMPLVALNFLYNFNTFRVLAGGETGLGAATPMARFLRFFVQGIPRLVGLKQQWSEAWVLGPWLSIALLAIFIAAITIAVFIVLKKFASAHVFDEKVVLVAALGLIFLANIVASWGSFQSEPRRLLLVYVPLVLLVVWGMAKRPGILIAFCTLWFGVSAYANVTYVRANLHGFNSPLYRSYKPVAEFLGAHNINHVYVNVWEGSKIAFDSHMRITWSANPYMPSSSGFYSDNNFSFHDAAVFYNLQPGGAAAAAKMRADLAIAGIGCVEKTVDSFVVIYACSENFNIRALPGKAAQLRQFKSQGVVFDWSTYRSGAFEDFYGREPAMVWTKPRVQLQVLQQVVPGDRLCIMAGRERKLDPADIHVMLGGGPIQMRSVGADGEQRSYLSDALERPALGGMLEIRVSPLVPARFGSGDSRSLGLPLRSIRFVSDASQCH